GEYTYIEVEGSESENSTYRMINQPTDTDGLIETNDSNLPQENILWSYYGCMFLLNFLQNGVLSSLGAFIYGPYGDLAYHLGK
ncbi:MAG: hypothetical protein AAF429_11730, partial [Pseudomonadota bacterium]